jgi:hypothetical protein
MSLTKSPMPFVIYYNITHKVCIFLQYHLISYSCAGHVVPPLNISYSMLYMTPPRSMFMISPINIPIFISQPLLFPSTCIHYLSTCLHALKCGHNSCPVCYMIQMPPYGRHHCVRLNFCGNSGARDNSTTCTVSYTVQ